MAGDFEVKIGGLEEAKATLQGLPDKLRRRALRNALAAGARLVRNAARARTPLLKRSTYGGAAALRRGVRSVGTVRNALSVRTSKAARRAGDVGVFVNVRPAKVGQRGATNPTDPYYWRWLNFGWNPASSAFGGKGSAGKRYRRAYGLARPGAKHKPGANFLQAGAAALAAALDKFKAVIGPQIARLNLRPKDPL